MDKIKVFFQKVKEAFLGLGSKFKKLDNKKKIIYSVSCVAILVLIVVIISLFVSSGNKEVSMGNINNNGFVDKSGSEVFLFYYNTNTEDGSSEKQGLYVESKKNIKLLENYDYVSSISVSGNYIYYVTISSEDFHREIVKMSKNGKNKTVLVDDIEGKDLSNSEMVILNDNIYFIGSENKLEEMKKDGSSRKQIGNEDVISFQIVGNKIYFLTPSGELKKMTNNGNDVEQISPINMNSFQIVNDKIYFSNSGDKYLKNMDLDGENVEDVVADFVMAYNISDGYIYFAKANDDGQYSIYKRKLNGNEDVKVVDLKGLISYISVVNKWIYYTDKIEDNDYYYTMYKVKTDGKDKEMIKVD